ncbi:hypothetical protein CDV36_015699 [Fusarium kuroshium]|uniref:Uncharacterized protein n=2 Tax=Fusarium solani species complex TaxID=232080 RepID=A0A3M2R8X1_9HYPO|nr:hypothetical protein CDV36_015699 [Fusarium kuroshium]RSL40123.1 hypothetical protein CEP51_016733 [Fusarium floridanum]
MPKPDEYDGFCRIPLSPELQYLLRETDQSPATIGQMEKLNLREVDMRRLPWKETEKEAAALKAVQELLSLIKDWPGKKDLPMDWEGGDFVLFKNALLTEKNERHIFLPRPCPAIQDSKVDVRAIIHNKKTGTSMKVAWEESHAFMLDEDVRIIAMDVPIRFFLLRITLPGRS